MTTIFHEPPPDNGLPVPSLHLQVQAPSALEPPQPPCLDDKTRDEILGGIRSLIGDRYPHAFLTSLCVPDQAAGDARAFGLWPAGPQNPTPDQLDELLGYLRGPIGRQFGETIAFAFSEDFLSRQAYARVGRYDGEGNADPNGPVHIENAWVELSPPDTVITKATGFDERPVPDADFTLTFTEPLTLSLGQFDVQTKRSLDVDSTWQDILDVALSFTGMPWSDLGLYQSIELHTAGPPKDKTGVGAGIVDAFLQPTFAVPGGTKIAVFYTHVEVTAQGIEVGGQITGQAARIPALAVSPFGGVAASIEFSQTQTIAERGFGISGLQDLLPPLSLSWAVDGEPAGNQPALTVQFSAPAPGTATVETVSLTVTDRDGLTAHAEIPVRLSSPRDKHHGPGGSGGPLNEP